MNKSIVIHLLLLLALMPLLFLLSTPVQAQQHQVPANTDSLIRAIENDPDNFSLHEAYLNASGFARWGTEEKSAFIRQYRRWMKKFPKSAVVTYGIGHAYAARESPKARPYLLEAIKQNPEFDRAYFDLWVDADRWGEFEKGREYIRKASEINPSNPDYAFYYANSFDRKSDEYIHRSLDVVNRFPESERGAQALYWLGARSNDPVEKAKYYQMLQEKYDPAKFNWSASGMNSYFDLLLVSSPRRAEDLAETMGKVAKDERSKAIWRNNQDIAKNIAIAKEFLASGDPCEAITILDSIKLHRRAATHDGLLILRANAHKENNNLQKAYDILLGQYAANPSSIIGEALLSTANALNKSKEKMDRDVWHIRDTAAKKATDFSLNQYFQKGKKSLKDFEGKVVLLTYWFPGCGPCRGEFPHFQNVVDKFSADHLAYLGINIVSEQNDYVVPFLKSSGYTFIPLEDYEGREKGILDNYGAAPMNFLIDQKGNIVFRNFRTDGNNEDVLYNMIQSTIERRK